LKACCALWALLAPALAQAADLPTCDRSAYVTAIAARDAELKQAKEELDRQVLTVGLLRLAIERISTDSPTR
jgi:hypothetical protein